MAKVQYTAEGILGVNKRMNTDRSNHQRCSM